MLQVSGVYGGSIDESGTLIRLDLRPGADADRVAAEAGRAVSAHVEDRTAVRLEGATAAALRGEEWRDLSTVANSSAAEGGPVEPEADDPRPRRGWWLLALLLACGVVGFCLVSRKRRDPYQTGDDRRRSTPL